MSDLAPLMWPRLWPRLCDPGPAYVTDLCVGKAYALANDQYDPGGGTQYYITAKDRMSMERGPITELTGP